MDFISATFYKYVTEQLNTVQFENVTDAIDTIKAIKSDEEIKLIRDTCHLQDVIFEYVLSRVRPGRKAAEIQAEIVIKSMELGGDKTNIKVDVISGTGNSSAHPVISNGDQVSFLIETNGPSGFWAEIGRNICISKISPELQEQFGLAQQVQKITLDILKPGAQPDEMWNANNTFLRKQGYPEERRIYAHSQGYDMVERPSLDLFESIKIHAGMNIVVHPEVVSSKARGWVCENYIVKETGKAECLHQTPQKIFVV
jgi:Xaa-Pro aminopeptidase